LTFIENGQPVSVTWPKIYHIGQNWPYHLIGASCCNRENDHNGP